MRPGHLRLATPKQNNENRGLSPKNTTGYRGVTFSKRFQKFVAQVQHHNRNHFAGHFDTAVAAGEAASRLRAALFTHSNEEEFDV